MADSFQCPDCPRSFATKGGLSVHRFRAHGKKAEVDTLRKKIYRQQKQNEKTTPRQVQEIIRLDDLAMMVCPNGIPKDKISTYNAWRDLTKELLDGK